LAIYNPRTYSQEKIDTNGQGIISYSNKVCYRFILSYPRDRCVPCGLRWIVNAYWYNNNDDDDDDGGGDDDDDDGGDDDDDDDSVPYSDTAPTVFDSDLRKFVYLQSVTWVFVRNYVILTVCSISTNWVDGTHAECKLIL